MGQEHDAKQTTLANAKSYIRPWVNYLKERDIAPSSSSLKAYIDELLVNHKISSKKKIAKEIIKFTKVN